MAFQQCTKTLMDNISDPDIRFDEEGVCNYWYDYQKAEKEMVLTGEEGKKRLEKLIDDLKRSGHRKNYDCILGLSGGVDSSYTAYIAKKYGLRPLIVHFDNGWNSRIAVKNMQNIIKSLDADLHTLVVDWEEFKSLQIAYLKASVVDIEVLTDHAIFATLYQLAHKHNISHILSGNNVQTEFLIPKHWIYNKTDAINIQDINRKFGNKKLKTYPLLTPLKKKYYLNLKKLEYVSPLNNMEYDKKDVIRTIQKEFDWEDYGGKHHESIFTKFYQTYILPEKFRIDKRKAHLSNLICSHQMTREEAIKELDKPMYDKDELEKDKAWIDQQITAYSSLAKDYYLEN